ncbi:MAG TPA: DUF2567 domain-containing protein [Micromonosporaceae bacterium]|nr:DUF2567 domain-containing protein [Micromonosporaceae bacterium]
MLTLLGAPLGLLWLLVSPEVPVMKIRDELPDWPGWRRGSIPVQPQPEGYIAADGWFSLLGLGFGILAAVAVWWVLRRQRGTVGLVAVVLGSLGAAWLASWLGSEIALAEYHRARDAVAVGELFQMPPQLRSGEIRWVGPLPVLRGVLLLPAFGAAVAYTLLAGWSRYPTLRPEPPALPDWVSAVSPFSWDPAAPQTPPAPPAPPATGGAAPPHG